MREVQKLIQGIITLLMGVILITYLPKNTGLIEALSFYLIILASILLIIFWFVRNFLEDFIKW